VNQDKLRSLSRVVWAEGMHLGPHHFQAQNRYFEDLIEFAAGALHFAPFGLIGVTWNQEGLYNGILELTHARGFLPDGLPFLMPEAEPLPESRFISDLISPVATRVTIYLALREYETGGRNCDLSGAADGAAVRFSAEIRSVPDETTGLDARPVRLGRKNFRLLLENEVQPGYTAMPIGRVMRDGAGHLVLDPDFIPPALSVQASPRLMAMTDRLIDILEEKSATIAAGRRAPGVASGFYGAQELARFWFLHAVNSALPQLRHLARTKRAHPEELFLAMSRLAGALCTFALNAHPRDLPSYKHLALEESFGALDGQIRAHLETVLPSNSLVIPLELSTECFYEGEVRDGRCFHKARWILGVRSPMAEAELISLTPILVKVCSRAFIERLVAESRPAMRLTHLPVPPPGVAARVDMQYFSISLEGGCWVHLQQTRRVGVYVPAEIPQAELELTVVLDS